MRTFAVSVSITAVFALAACDGQKPATQPGASGDAAPATAQKAPDAPAQPAAAPAAGGDEGKVKVVAGPPPGGDDRYELKIETPEATAGQATKVTVKVVPKEPWHMNLDFPTSLKVQPPDGVKVVKADQKKGDAVKLDDNNCVFAVDFTPESAGDKSFTGKFKFAVCQDEACSPVTEQVEFKVAVK